MDLPAFQQGVSSRFKNFDFQVRGWTRSTASDKAKTAFNEFISEVNTSQRPSSLKTKNIHVKNKVALVSLSK